MTAYLLDVNVLVALSWPGHEFHDRVQKWFARNARKGRATCPMVEAGFVRISSNPGALANLQDRVIGHQKITAAYLLALAIHHRGKSGESKRPSK